MKRDLFSSILFLALQQKIDFGETLKFALIPVPLCLTYTNGSMQKINASSTA